MKKIIAVLITLVILAAATAVAYTAGKNHVIHTQELWILDDEHDEAHDVTIYADIDGQWHEYGGFIGLVVHPFNG